MATLIEYALMAGASYVSTRADINKFPIPQGWAAVTNPPRFHDDATGFEAAAFQNGTDFVISFAGTYPTSPGDWAANIGLATGEGSVQLEQAARYYLDVQRQNPGATITLTGQSLGGGLAALVGVFFHVPATTFDQAPFANSAQTDSLLSNPLNILTPDVAAELKTTLLNDGYTEAELAPLTNFLLIRPTDGSIPNSNLVSTIRVDGEFTSALGVGAFDPIGNPATVITHGPHIEPSIDLHDHALLTDFLMSDATAQTVAGQKQSLSEVTKKLTSLLGMMFDGNLYSRTTNATNTSEEDFLNHLLRHEAGNVPMPGGGTVSADAMVARFTSDLWKLAQDGGLTLSENFSYANWNNVSKALIAFAMQKYYEENNPNINYGTELFTDLGTAGLGSNGITFDIANVSQAFNTKLQSGGVKYEDLVNDIKGFGQYFQNYIDTTGQFSSEERTLIKSILPTLRDWYVQAGASGMITTDTLNRGAFMLGGSQGDALVGGTAADLLVGNAGTDLLQGGKGNDTLLGGTGNDAYVYATGDGLDTILDTAGQNTLAIDGAVLAGGDQYGDASVHKDANGHLYVHAGNNLIIDGNIIIQNYGTGGTFGLTMNGAVADVIPQTTLFGTSNDDDIDAGLTNVANDVIDAGACQDSVFAGQGDDVVIGGAGSDALDGYGGNDHLYADNFIGIADAIAQGNTQNGSGLQGDALSGDAGNDTLIGSTGNDILAGGSGADLLVAGAGDDYVFGDTDWAAGKGRNWGVVNNVLVGGAGGIANWSGDNTDVIYAGSGNDRVWGELGNDVLFGEKGDDLLVGGSGNDVILGGDNNDIIYGDVAESASFAAQPGSDYLDGGAGDDTIYGNEGDDILIGGFGNDILNGGAGQDTYVYNVGDGIDNIFDTKADHNILRFGAGINKDNIKLHLGSLLLDLGNGDQIHIGDFDQNNVFNSSSISSFEFSDGSTLSTAELLARGFDLDGTAGNDVITGTNTVDRINGYAGDDTLSGGDGNDVLDGGTGNDLLRGGAGNDTYLFNVGDGQDELLDYNGTNNIVFGAGINLADLSLSASIGSDGKAALLIRTSGGDSLTIDGERGLNDSWTSNTGAVCRFEFADGSRLSSDQLLAQAKWDVLQEADILKLEGQYIAQRQANTRSSGGYVQQADGSWYKVLHISGGMSLHNTFTNQTLMGVTTASNSWQFYGNTISDTTLKYTQSTITSNAAVINVSPSSSFTSSYSQAGLQVQWAASTTPAYSYNFQSYYYGSPYIYSRETYISPVSLLYATLDSSLVPYSSSLLSSGQGIVIPQIIPVTVIHNQTTINYQTINIGAGNHTVYGGDVVNAGSGNNLIEAGTGNFVYGGTGNNTIRYSSIVYAGSGNNTIERSGTVYAGSGNNTIYNNNVVYGGTGNNRIDWVESVYYGSGNDVVTNSGIVYDGAGDDLYVGNEYVEVGSGSGNDTILSSPSPQRSSATQTTINADMTGNLLVGGIVKYAVISGKIPLVTANDYASLAPLYSQIPNGHRGLNSIVFGSGILPSDLRFSWGQADIAISGLSTDPKSKYTTLNITWGTNNQSVQVIIPHYDEPVGSGVSLFNFADGSRLSMADMIAMAPPAPSFDPQITGFIFKPRMGAQILPTGIDRIQFTADIVATSVGVTQNSQGDFLISYNNGASSLIVPAQSAIAAPVVASFANGANWQFVNAAGNPYTYTAGSGVVYIANPSAVQFGAGITPGMITLGLGSLMLSVGNNGDVLHIEGFNATDALNSTSINSFTFADGTMLTYDQMLGQGFDLYGTSGNDTLSGTNLIDRMSGGAGDDVLNGGAGDDVLTGGIGKDTLIGGAGNDTYHFNRGDGADVILDSAEGGGSINTLVLGAGITAAMISPVIDANGIVTLDFGPSTSLGQVRDSIRINQTGNLSVQNIRFSDGSVIAVESLLNAPPVAVADLVAISEDGAQAMIAVADLLANDTDPDAGDVLSLAGFDAVTAQGNAVVQDAAGNLVLNIGDRYQSLGAGQSMTDSFGYTISDAAGLTSIAMVNVSIAGVNDAPVMATAIVGQQTNEAAPFSFAVPAGTFTDIDNGDTLSYSATLADGTALPTWLSFDAATQTFSGTPGNWDVGNYSVTVTATDTGGLSASSTFAVDVANVNDAPIVSMALLDQGTLQDAAFSFHVPAGTFTDVDFIHGDTLSYSATLADGTALPTWLSFDAATQTFSGTPTNGDVGVLNVQVTATDTGGLSASSAFNLNIVNVNDAPTANADSGTAIEDGGPVLLNAATLLANDADPDFIHGDLLNIVVISQAASGAVVSLANGGVQYDIGTLFQSLAQGQTATDTFSYTVSDKAGATSTATVTMTVTGVNDGPVTVNDTAAVQEDASLIATGNVLANDSDVDQGTVLSVANAGTLLGNYGSLLLNADGSYTYMLDNASLAVQSLAAGQVVTETFAYQATDGIAFTPATLTVTIVGSNDTPVTVADVAAAQEDATIIATGNVLVNDSDVDLGAVLSVANAGVFVGSYGSLTLAADGSYSYALDNASPGVQSLAAGQVVAETFAYQATDGTVATPSTLTISITGTNDAPVTVADVASVQEDLNITATGNVLANDSDVDQGAVLSVADAGVRAGSYGSLALAADGSYTYSLDNSSATLQSLGRTAQVAEHFGYTATDGIAGTTSVLDVFLSGANDAPILVSPLVDQYLASDKHFSWQMPAGSFTDIDQGDVLDYTATMADGSALPEWLKFDAATRTFSGEAPKERSSLDVRITATDKVAATGSTDGSLSASDVFHITVSRGNEGVGNGQDAPPPGHGSNSNDGAGTSPGHPGSSGGKNRAMDSGSHAQGHESDGRSSDSKADKRDAHAKEQEDSGSHRTDELIQSWFDEESASEQFSSFSSLGRKGGRGSQTEWQVNRNVAKGIAGDVSSEWERMNARLKQHLEQGGGDEGSFADSGAGTGSFGLYGLQAPRGSSLPGMGGIAPHMNGFSGLREGLERLAA